ncbi:MAG: Spx/MgsR family RNA polymerase-binding regulatory protein [Nostocales cyanobacterium 94392]|nr:Spx/MgsR family RNA polymerase-binding regulatory protein [Nostocales cyanobacterium 94392]
MSIQVYGIPNCGSCKKAFLWLQNHHIEYEFINIKENPPSKDIIANWVENLGSKRMRNTSGESYRALGESKKTWTDQQWIEAFAHDAMLLKRPLFVKDTKAVLVGLKDIEAIGEKLES